MHRRWLLGISEPSTVIFETHNNVYPEDLIQDHEQQQETPGECFFCGSLEAENVGKSCAKNGYENLPGHYMTPTQTSCTIVQGNPLDLMICCLFDPPQKRVPFNDPYKVGPLRSL